MGKVFISKVASLYVNSSALHANCRRCPAEKQFQETGGLFEGHGLRTFVGDNQHQNILFLASNKLKQDCPSSLMRNLFSQAQQTSQYADNSEAEHICYTPPFIFLFTLLNPDNFMLFNIIHKHAQTRWLGTWFLAKEWFVRDFLKPVTIFSLGLKPGTVSK